MHLKHKGRTFRDQGCRFRLFFMDPDLVFKFWILVGSQNRNTKKYINFNLNFDNMVISFRKGGPILFYVTLTWNNEGFRSGSGWQPCIC